MSGPVVESRPLPVADPEAFKAECMAMLDWVGGLDLPIHEKGLREAAGCLGGILVGVFTASRASFVAKDSADIAALCDRLRQTAGNPVRRRILETFLECAAKARDTGTDLEVAFG